MRPFEDLINESSSLHGHLCAGQILGVRMAMAGCRSVGIDEPKGCKKLLVFIETDRCATDAIQAVTGCSLGRRTLKFLDYGKMAATFFNLETKEAFRVLARDEARSLAVSVVERCSGQHEAEKEAYALMPEESLLSVQPVRIHIPDEDTPGARWKRVLCDQCGEGMDFKREIRMNGRTLCIPCAQGRYLPQSGRQVAFAPRPGILLVVGRKNVGKTTLIERLVPELSVRGYRVGTIKHHHASSPMMVDHEGKDSWRHRKAGARSVALISPTQVALFRDTEERIPLNDLMGYFEGVDIVLVEGFRSEPIARIEVWDTLQVSASSDAAEGLRLATITSQKRAGEVPYFKPEEIHSLVDLIERKIMGRVGLEAPTSAQSSTPFAL